MNTPHDCIRASVSPRLRTLTTARLLAAFAVSGFAAYAQTASSPSPATTPTPGDQSTIQLGTYTVSGYSQSLQTSLNAKRASNDNVDVISAEDIGKFPDGNLAESLSHIPGVTVDYLFGEGERVSILGTDPNLNRVLLNGEPVSSADWYILDNQSRQFNYLLLSPDVINQAEVFRTWEPKLLEGSIGGTVNVTTRNPLDLDPTVVAGTVSGAYNDRSDKTEASENAMFSWHNADKTFGFLVGGENNREYLRRDGVEALSEQTNNNLGVGGPVTGQPAGPWVTDEVVNTAIFEQLRQHQGGNISLDFKPSDQWAVELTGMYVKQTMDNVNYSYYIYPGDNWSGLPNITNPTVTDGVLNKYTINSAPLVIDAFNRAAEIKTLDYGAKVTYKGDNFDLTTNVGYTRATGGTQHQFFGEYFVFANANISESASQASFANATVPGVDPTGAGLANGSDFNATGQPGFDYGNIASNPEVDDEKWVQMDLDVPINGVLKDFLAGFRFSDHDAGENGNVVSVPGLYENGPGTANAPTLSAIGVVSAPSNYLSGLPGVTSAMSNHPVLTSYGSVANFIGNLSAASLAGGHAGETLLQYFDTQPPSDAAVFTATPTFTIDERITAVYLENNFNWGQLGGNFGVRGVETTTTSSSYNLSTPGSPTLMTVKNTYDNVLPAVNLVYNLPSDQLVRFAVAEVIARPNTSAEANYVELFDQSLSGVGGNADLNPYEAINFDADYEWYFTKNSYFAVDLFYKDIKNYILNAVTPEQWTDYSLTGNPMETYEITRPTNAGKAKSDGVSLSYQQAIAAGFGIQANYTRLETSTSDNNGPLPFSSKDEVNLSPYFENKLWGVPVLLRATYSWRDDYKSLSFNSTTSVYTAPYAEFDANAEIHITKNISLLLAAKNLLDETYHQYFKNPDAANLFYDAYKTGRTYTASIHLNF
jgi:iron complex outermembrane receptor protein